MRYVSAYVTYPFCAFPYRACFEHAHPVCNGKCTTASKAAIFMDMPWVQLYLAWASPVALPSRSCSYMQVCCMLSTSLSLPPPGLCNMQSSLRHLQDICSRGLTGQGAWLTLCHAGGGSHGCAAAFDFNSSPRPGCGHHYGQERGQFPVRVSGAWQTRSL